MKRERETLNCSEYFFYYELMVDLVWSMAWRLALFVYSPKIHWNYRKNRDTIALKLIENTDCGNDDCVMLIITFISFKYKLYPLVKRRTRHVVTARHFYCPSIKIVKQFEFAIMSWTYVGYILHFGNNTYLVIYVKRTGRNKNNFLPFLINYNRHMFP